MSDVAIYFDFEFYVHRCNEPGFASDYIKIKEIKEVLIGHAFSNNLSLPSDSENTMLFVYMLRFLATLTQTYKTGLCFKIDLIKTSYVGFYITIDKLAQKQL